MKLTRVERFTLGIKIYGYDSQYRKEIETLIVMPELNINTIDDVLDKYDVPIER